jgi:hypothetical protein
MNRPGQSEFRCESVQVEGQVNDDLDCDRMSLVHSRLEPVLTHRFDGLFVKTHPQMTDDANVLGIPLRVDNELDLHIALQICDSGLLCEFRLDRVQNRGALTPPPTLISPPPWPPPLPGPAPIPRPDHVQSQVRDVVQDNTLQISERRGIVDRIESLFDLLKNAAAGFQSFQQQGGES